jgi:hypothetical protein
VRVSGVPVRRPAVRKRDRGAARAHLSFRGASSSQPGSRPQRCGKGWAALARPGMTNC